MKDKKKVILGLLKMRVKSDDEFEKQIMELAIKKLENIRNDGWGVYYSKGGKRLVAAKKALEGVYTVKEDTEEICDNAFWGCPFLTNVAIPASVRRIGDEAFARCISLQSVCIPPSVEELGANPFLGLDAKVLNNQSAAFSVEAKMLFDADRTRLVSALTDAAMLIVPKTVKTIGSLAFSRRSKLKKVQLPEGLECIERDAFSDCDALEEVTIPASVATVAPYAFAGCEKLKKVTFLGVVKDLARTAFSDDFELTTINVPAGAEKKFRKQLHLTSESETLVLSI